MRKLDHYVLQSEPACTTNDNLQSQNGLAEGDMAGLSVGRFTKTPPAFRSSAAPGYLMPRHYE